MKSTRVFLALITVMAATIASAQTIQFVFVTKAETYTQTSTADPANVANPFMILASIDGTSGDPLTGSYPVSPTVAVQSGSQSLITLSPPGGNDSSWSFESAGFADQATLNAAYGSGNYTFQSSSFSNIVLSLSNADLYPNAPKAIISTNTGLGFQWINNTLEVNPSLFSTLTITTNTFTTNFSSTANHLGINGQNFQTEVSAESFNSATNSISVDIAAATFLSGSASKSIELEFNNLISMIPDTPVAGANSISAFSTFTTFNIQVIPEPSTYAAIFGGLALAGVMIVRRRRTARDVAPASSR